MDMNGSSSLVERSSEDSILLLSNETNFNAGEEFNHGGNLRIEDRSIFQGGAGGLGAYEVQKLANNGAVNLQDGAVGDVHNPWRLFRIRFAGDWRGLANHCRHLEAKW